MSKLDKKLSILGLGGGGGGRSRRRRNVLQRAGRAISGAARRLFGGR